MQRQRRRGRWGIVIAMALLGVAAAGPAFGQALSDLHWEGFEKHAGGPAEQTQSHANPFASGVSTVESLSVEDLQLVGIVYGSGTDAYALISGYLVRPGDLIAGYRVEAIERDRVRLDRVGQKFVLVLGGGLQ